MTTTKNDQEMVSKVDNLISPNMDAVSSIIVMQSDDLVCVYPWFSCVFLATIFCVSKM